MRRLPNLAAGIAIAAALTAATAIVAQPASARDRRDDPRFAASIPPQPAPLPANGAIFQASQGYAGLYEGSRAHAVGDPVTIVLVERTRASKSAGSNLDSKGGFSLLPPVSGPLSLFSPGDASASGTRGFDGAGSAGQSNALSGELTVTVYATYPNGTMLVQGRKQLTLNRGDEWIEIRGIIRRADIDENNRVPSTRVADAQIAYTGKGDFPRASRQGWLSRFFQIISPF